MGGGSVDVSAWTSHDHTARSTADERVERAGRPGSGMVHRAEGGFLGGLGQSAGSAEHARSLRRRIPPPAGLVVVAEAGSDVGNDRPRVTYDGLMVRRRVVIAIHPTSGTDLVFLRRKMDDAAARLHTTLSTISVSVLDPAVLENLTPEMAVALPAGATLPDARRLIDPATAEGRRLPEVAKYRVASVVVHDLRFTVRSADPVVLANTIDREGILSDALGNYSTTLGRDELDITYTGPLISDDLVKLVRAGIARGARTQPAAVTVSPRSTVGVGVDMAKGPAPAAVFTQISTSHNHGVVLPAVGGSSQSSPWVLSLAGVGVFLILTLVMLRARRLNQGAGQASVRSSGPDEP